jgi:hypothetical protein
VLGFRGGVEVEKGYVVYVVREWTDESGKLHCPEIYGAVVKFRK